MIDVKPIEEWESEKEDWTVFIDDASITYCQRGDSVDIEPINITISAVNNGAARFLKITTGENGWSFTDADEFMELLNDFKKRVEL